MNIRYDSDVDALYIKLREPVGKIVDTDFIDVARYVDYDEQDNVVGAESSMSQWVSTSQDCPRPSA